MWKPILKATLIAGSLDITAACVSAYLSGGILPDRVLKYIASGVFGKSAYEGGFGMMACGLFFHFMIAFACAAIFFWIYPKWKFFKSSTILNALFIGLIAWGVTNFVVIPFSRINNIDFDALKAFRAIAILVVCIGLPIALLSRRHYMGRQ